jgi:hypothetical protein
MGINLLLAFLLLLPSHPVQNGKRVLFNGFSLEGWELIDWEGQGKIYVKDSCIYIEKGLGISGIIRKDEVPKMNYELTLEAMRVDGSDFFCGVTFPVGPDFLTLVIGGWGGSITGLSCIDGEDAANNITYDFRKFENNRWYKIRLRVDEERIQAWTDDYQIVDFKYGNSYLSLRWEAEFSKPFGLMTWQTTGAFRKIRLETF